MAGEWRETTIGALCDAGVVELQTGPFGSQLHAYDYVADGVPVVPTEAIRARRIDRSVLPKISPVKAQELARHRLQPGDILFARRGAQATGHIGCIREAEDGFICGTGAIRLRINRFEDSELGEIPAGWDVGSVDDEFDLTMGQSPPGETYNEAGEGLPFYQGRADFGFRFPTLRVYCTSPTRFAKAGDSLISVRAPVGDVNMASEHCAIGRGVAAARHKTASRSYTYQFMKSLDEVFARFEAEGTVFGSIGKKDFHAIPCTIPSRELVLAYEARVLALDDRIEVNERESLTLAALRDTLLPKLISGELRVKDAERALTDTPV